MRLAIVCISLVAVASLPVSAAEPPLKSRLQGEWTKANFPHGWKVSGDTLTEFAESKPFAPHATGRLRFENGKAYAVAEMDNGFKLWLFSAGKDVMAVEVFDREGKIQGTGIVCYRRGFQP